MDKIYLGFKVREFLPGLETKPISKVEILNDNGEIVGEAGDNSGQTLTATNPDGSNEMATSILEAVEGFVYKPFSANDAIIDPSAELGDGISVAGMYSTLIQSNIDFSGGMVTANISAPINDEIEDEYPYISPIERQIQRNYAATKSIISKTAEEILLEVKALDENLGDKYTKLSQTVDDFTFEDEEGVVKIDGGVVDAEGLKVKAANITGTLTIGQLPSTVAETSDVTTIINGTVTTNYINALDITARYLKGQIVYLLTSYGYTAGSMSITGSSSSNYAVDLTSGGALRLSASSGAAYISGGGASTTYDNGNAYTISSGGGYVLVSGDTVTLGTTAKLSSGATITSDRDKKHSIEYMDEPENAETAAKYDVLFDGLRFARFKYNDGTSDRYHTALIANDVEESIFASGLTTKDVAAFCRMKEYAVDENGMQTEEVIGETCALRYDEFVGMLIHRVQRHTKEIAELKQENAELKSRLLTIEEKLTKMGV